MEAPYVIVNVFKSHTTNLITTEYIDRAIYNHFSDRIMKYLLFILLLITSCKAATPEYNPETIYLIVQSPKYNLYLPKNDMIKSLDKKYEHERQKLNYDCIKKLSQTDSIKVSSDFSCFNPSLLENNMEKYEEESDRYDAFYFCAIDLFKKHKVLVYDKIQEKWISKYKISHRVLKNVEYNAFYEVLYNDSLIYIH